MNNKILFQFATVTFMDGGIINISEDVEIFGQKYKDVADNTSLEDFLMNSLISPNGTSTVTIRTNNSLTIVNQKNIVRVDITY